MDASTTVACKSSSEPLPSWASLLVKYVDENAIRGGNFDAEHDVELRMKEIFAERHSKALKNQPTFHYIPRFHYSQTELKLANGDPARNLLRKLARNRFLQRKNADILTETDLNKLCSLLSEIMSGPQNEADPRAHGMISYEELVRIGESLPESASEYFSAMTFHKFRQNAQGKISAHLFFEYVCKHVSLLQTRIQLSVYDSQGDGYLREQDLENYVYELIPTLEPLVDLQENFYPFYVFTAVRKFFFFLDPRRTCKISIKDMLTSPVLEELLFLRDESFNEEADPRNWFSAHNALRVYSQYLELDIDHNGMLSKSELAQYGTATLSDVFIDRIFEECHTYDGEMDYKTFLDFVLAMENKKSKQALGYFWRLLDIKQSGYLDIFTINYFFRQIVKKLKEIDGDVVSVADVKDEIFDMVRPVMPTKITLNDLMQCGQGDTVVSMLTDLHGFWEYDNRENIIAEEAREELEMEALQASDPSPVTQQPNA